MGARETSKPTSTPVAIEIAGRPVPKARARRGAHGNWYTPTRTRVFEEGVAWEARAARVRLGTAPIECEIELHLAGELGDDIDNYVKAILDGLQRGEAFVNDRQVVALTVRKLASSDEKTIVRLRALEAA